MADTYDVAVIGAGIAGLASSVFLQKAGLRVVCVDTRAYPHHKVGESLDWSSPNMLQRVGIPREALIDDQIATYKKGIIDLRARTGGLGRQAAAEHPALAVPLREC